MPHRYDDNPLFRTLISTAVDGIIVIDASGLIEVYNDSCTRLFGYSAEEVAGRNVSMLMPSPYREEHDGYMEHYRRTGKARIIGIGREVVGQRKDGTTFPMYLSVGEGVIEGRKIYVGIIRDLTARNRNAHRMQELQNEILHVSRLSAMGQMTGAIAHELNQPLTAILNYLSAARRLISLLPDGKHAKLTELMEKAASQTSRAGHIIRQLRDFVEKRETARVEANLNSVIEEALALASLGAADANVKVMTQLAPDLPPVLIDRIQLEQVMINLVRNSIEAMERAPRRELRIATAADADGWVEVVVADSGPGLPPEVSSRLFHPFVTTKDKGMGIGLSICRSIIEAHGGRIWAAPNPASGAAFHFRLPPSSLQAQ